MMNLCAKFRSNSSTTYGDITSREIGVNGQQTDGRRDNSKTRRLSPPTVGDGGTIIANAVIFL